MLVSYCIPFYRHAAIPGRLSDWNDALKHTALPREASDAPLPSASRLSLAYKTHALPIEPTEADHYQRMTYDLMNLHCKNFMTKKSDNTAYILLEAFIHYIVEVTHTYRNYTLSFYIQGMESTRNLNVESGTQPFIYLTYNQLVHLSTQLN